MKKTGITDGAQDIYLTGNPQITFFKVVYRRHTNFALESIQQTFNGTVDFNRKVTCTVSRNGDLIHRTYLQVTLPALTVGSGKTVKWVEKVGHALIDYVNIEIGGQEIDRHYGDWLNIWNELTQTAEHMDGHDVLIGNTTGLKGNADTSTPETVLYIPLQFWFCRNPGLALPLIALQYHEVKFNISFRPANELIITSDGNDISPTPVMGDSALWIDYIYLDTDERRQFAQVQHEYLIEQLQYTGAESYSNSTIKSKLSLNHPCKELVWVLQLDSNAVAKKWFDYTSSDADILKSGKLQLNGHDRFDERDAKYFGVVQPYQHHTNIPQTGVYVYSFALNPEQHQPSGTVNMSRIDNATLLLNLNSSAAVQLRTYATNYNVLRIMAGMGGLAYSN